MQFTGGLRSPFDFLEFERIFSDDSLLEAIIAADANAEVWYPCHLVVN